LGTRHSLRPLFSQGEQLPHNSGASRRGIAKACRARTLEGEGEKAQTRSVRLTIFWHCGFGHFSFRTDPKARRGNKPSMVLAEDAVPKGLAMLIRSEKYGIQGGAANAVRAQPIPAASLPTLLLGGLLLICP
jgi:hypothetical protein